MADYVVTDEQLSSIADAIREMTGDSDLLEFPDGFESAIRNIVGAVTSVNGQTGTVVLDADDVGALPDTTTASDLGAYVKPSGGIPASDLASAVQTSLGKADTALQSAPVTSVNGQTGAVSLSIPSTAADVGAISAPSSPATGAFLVYNGSAWVAQTLSTWQGGSY